ncbi:MAG: hypothetical protein ACRD1C_01945 [Terriglobales bacterium]
MPENKIIHPRHLVRRVRRLRHSDQQPQAATPAPRAGAADPAKPTQARAAGGLPDKPGGAQPAAEPVQRRGEVQNRIIGVVGRKGSGKSTKLRQLLRYCPRWVAFDPMRDHAALAAGNVFESIPGLARFLRWSREQPTFAGVYVPQGDPAEEIEEASRLVYARGGLCFVCEEVPLYTQAGYIPPLFGRLIRTGRHRRIDVSWTAQRAAEVPKTLTSLTDSWVLFSQTEPKDLAALAERCGREVADRVASLGAHEFVLWDAVARTYLADSPRLLRQDTAQREAEA